MVAPILNSIDPPPRLTGIAGQDTVAIIQWLSAFYTKGILSGGLLQTQNLAPVLAALAALTGAADKIAYYTGEETLGLADLTAYARTLLAAIDAPAARTVLGAGIVEAVTGTAPVTSSGGTTPAIGISDFIGSGLTHARGVVPDPGAAAGTVKFLREDASWATPPGAGDVVGPAVATSGHVAVFSGATGKIIGDGGALGSAAFTASTAYLGVADQAADSAQLLGATWVAPGAIGSTTPSTGNFTTGGYKGASTITGAARYEFIVDEDASASAGRGGGIAFAQRGAILGGISALEKAASNQDSELHFSYITAGTVTSGGTMDVNGLNLINGVGTGGVSAQASGIAFPAIAVSVSNVNTLDDYKEYTAPSAACTGAITTACVWKATKSGNIVVLTLPGVLGAGVATTNFVFGEALPTEFRPVVAIRMPCVVYNNSAYSSTPGGVQISTAGVISIYRNINFAGNFTVTANAGIAAPVTVSWTI